MSNRLSEAMDLVKRARPMSQDEVAKAAGWLQSSSAVSGITYYDLEAPAKKLYPVLTPLRNSLPRVKAGGGIQANWRAITGINITGQRIGLSEGNRGAAIEHSTADYTAVFREFGTDDFVSFKAQNAAEGFDDVRARAVEGLLSAVMIGEERMILGGNTSVALGTANTPTVSLNTDSTSGVTNGTLTVQVVGLTFQAYWDLVGANNGATGQSLAIGSAEPGTVAVFTRTNIDGSSDTYNGGVGQVSSASSGVTIDATHKSALATVVRKNGEFGYAWYVAVNGGTAYLHSITTVNRLNITADPSTTTAVHSNLGSDHSICSLEFDGFLYQALKSGSGAYVKSFTGGAQLTTDGAGGCTELNTFFQDRYDLYRLSPDELHVGSQVLMDLNSLVIKNGGAPLIRYAIDASGPVPKIDAGVAIGTILNKITNTRVKVIVHPNMPPGSIFGRATELPYKLPNVTDVYRMLMRQDYYEMSWPIIKRRWEYGVYADGVLQNYFPPACGVLLGITPGIA